MAHCVYHIYGVLKLLEIAVYFAYCSFFEICTAVMRTVLTMAKKSLKHYFLYGALCISHLWCFETFRNCSLFCTF